MTRLTDQQRTLLQAVRRLAVRGEAATAANLKAETGWLGFQVLGVLDQLVRRGVLKRIGPAYAYGNPGRAVVIVGAAPPQLMEGGS